MPVKEIDRDKLRAAIRNMGDEFSYYLLDDAIDLLSQAQLRKLIKDYFDPEKLRPNGICHTIFEEVNAFREASLSGKYYEDFNVNSKNYMDKSRGTLAWISECCQLLDRLVKESSTEETYKVCASFDVIFSLLEHIDECHDDVIFFADEGGSWQVGVRWDQVFPSYFKCLAKTAVPDAYAKRVVSLVDNHEKYRRKKHLTTARRAATLEQKAALHGA